MSAFMTDLLELSFLQNALLAGLLAGVSCGVIGSYVVTRRISTIAGSIAHSVLGGLGCARYLQTVAHWDWLNPLYGAIAAALLSAFVIGLVSLKARQREDTVISAIWAAGAALGILFIYQTPAYGDDLMSYLFGNILMVSPEDLWMIGMLDVATLLIAFVFYQPLLLVCFDEEFARTRGIPVDRYYLLLLCLIALTVVLLITVVGMILVIALLTLPAAVASLFARRLWQMMIIASLLTMMLTAGGLMLSYSPNLPAGATTVLLAALLYLGATVSCRLFRRFS